MVGSKAATPGTALMPTGMDQVSPPSKEREKAMPSKPLVEKRASCHAAASTPCGPTAIEPSVEPSRTGTPVAGSEVPTDCTGETVNGADQLIPLSVERTICSVTTAKLPAEKSSLVKKSTSVPSGSTTI